MELDPDVFWRLTVREFWIKHDAFVRKEDRAEAALMRQALRTHRYKDRTRNLLNQEANRRKRYPVKPWLKSE